MVVADKDQTSGKATGAAAFQPNAQRIDPYKNFKFRTVETGGNGGTEEAADPAAATATKAPPHG